MSRWAPNVPSVRTVAALGGIVACARLVDYVMVENDCRWAWVGLRQPQQWLVLARPLGANERVERDGLYLRRVTTVEDGVLRSTRSVVHSVAVEGDFVSNGRFETTLVSSGKVVMTPARMTVDPVAVGDSDDATSADFTDLEVVYPEHAGVLREQPLLRMWPYPPCSIARPQAGGDQGWLPVCPELSHRTGVAGWRVNSEPPDVWGRPTTDDGDA